MARAAAASVAAACLLGAAGCGGHAANPRPRADKPLPTDLCDARAVARAAADPARSAKQRRFLASIARLDRANDRAKRRGELTACGTDVLRR